MADSIHFYRDILGLEPTEGKSETFFAFNTGDTTLALEPNGTRKESKKTKAENPVLLQFKLPSQQEFDEFTIHLEAHGVIILEKSRQTGYGLLTNFCDPDGNKLEVMY